ncbi:hypothetical protein F2Q69_00037870 [Brassica cretica]|uniref:Uncharacterized protein n=1 Tax=Brassica cretica TaxID=69181 RepID=A0A8S9SLJ2_BRACR|nr:hypothetical protein F2Q69_00037870 [Brassica cretica]
MEPGGCSQGESRPEGVESDRRERWAQSGWVKVTAAQLDEFPTCLDFQDTLDPVWVSPSQLTSLAILDRLGHDRIIIIIFSEAQAYFGT